ncbi:MAG TPA: peptidylprolyl isomerase [Candidatus Limnocylindrales bacterium]
MSRRIAIVVLLGAALAVGSCSAGATPPPTTRIGPAQSSASGACPTSQPPALAAGETRTVTIETPKGSIVIRVEGRLGPIAAGNFVALAACGYYDGVVFHRLVPGFVIQGGDPTGTGGGGPGYTIEDDPVTTQYGRGTVAMARTPQPHSQGSQFFVVLDDAARASLEQANTYAIFGNVVSGMDVVDAIAAEPNGGPPANAALDPIPMTHVTVSQP